VYTSRRVVMGYMRIATSYRQKFPSSLSHLGKVGIPRSNMEGGGFDIMAISPGLDLVPGPHIWPKLNLSTLSSWKN